MDADWAHKKASDIWDSAHLFDERIPGFVFSKEELLKNMTTALAGEREQGRREGIEGMRTKVTIEEIIE